MRLLIIAFIVSVVFAQTNLGDTPKEPPIDPTRYASLNNIVDGKIKENDPVIKIEVKKDAPIAPAPIARNVISRNNPDRLDYSTIQAGAQNQVLGVWADENQWQAFNAIAIRESGWNPNALNSRSGACGIPQALPCSKIQDKSVTGQVAWMIDYIKNRYDTPEIAYAHEQNYGWY